MIKPPVHSQVWAVAKIDANIVVPIEYAIGEGIAHLMSHGTITNFSPVMVVAVKFGKEGRRARSIKAAAMEKNLGSHGATLAQELFEKHFPPFSPTISVIQ